MNLIPKFTRSDAGAAGCRVVAVSPWKLTHGSGAGGHSGRQVTAAGWAAQVG